MQIYQYFIRTGGVKIIASFEKYLNIAVTQCHTDVLVRPNRKIVPFPIPLPI